MNPAALAAVLHGDLANALIASTPGGIERQEAAGQRTLIESAMLPKEIRGATREQLTEIGFKFHADVDDLFVTCDLPPGWAKRATHHSMHSDLIDDQGRKRARIFYKAAFYDRRAHMTVLCRFCVTTQIQGQQEGYINCVVIDGDDVVFDAGEYDTYDYRRYEQLIETCKEWLNTRYPGWQNPFAHW